MSKKLLITGGSGFIGSEICRQAVEEGHQVVSVSLSGRPDHAEPWVDDVHWIAANVLEPDAWREHLAGCDAVIHCVGGIRENRTQGETLERINDDSTEIVAWEAEHAGVPRIVFLSAEVRPPMVSPRFIEAKRHAESVLRGRGIRESILRPAFVYGPGRMSATAFARTLQVAEKVPGLRTRLRPIRPLHVEEVASAALRAALEEGYEGVISIDNIEYLAKEMKVHEGDGMAQPARRRLSPLIVGGIVAGAAVAVAAGTVLYRRRSKHTGYWNAIARYMPSRSS